jgi:hypothetical protein
MGVALPAGYVEVREGVYERIDTIQRRFMAGKTILPNKNTSSNRKPKQAVLNGAMGKAKGKKEDSSRIHVRVTVFRKRLTDPDNSTPKYALDCLRYAGVLQDDREQDITLETRQEKTRGQEETLIELFHDTGSI